MGDILSRDFMEAGDVLLYEGRGLLPKLIRFFDGTQVNHSGLYLGDLEVGEAVKEGVVTRSLDVSIGDHSAVFARRLTTTPSTMRPVLNVARTYIGQHQRYAYEQLLLLAFLGLSRKLKVTPILNQLLRRLLDAAAGVLVKLTSGGRQPMICSEFVYRCYDEALPQPIDVYSLRVGDMAVQPPPDGSGVSFSLGTVVAAPLSRGRGVHPHSVLVWEMTQRRAGVVFDATPPGEVTEAELEGLIQKYFHEVQQPGTVPSFEAGGDAELARATERFALAYQESTAGPSRDAVSFAGAGPIEHLFRAASDFVAPGDLLHTQSLVSLGEVK
jgi:hypothetical protein